MYTRVRMLGVNLDIDPVDLPPTIWSEAANMVATPGVMKRARGYIEIYPTVLFSPIYLQYLLQNSRPFWLYCGALNIAVIRENGTHADATPPSLLSPVPDNGWSGGTLNGIAILNSFENEPYYWFNGIGGNALPLPGQRPNTRYRVMRPFKYHLIGLGVLESSVEYNDAVHWSDAADPGQLPASWVPAADNEAGDNILADENGDIIDGLALRDSFFIYKQDTVYEMTYIGGNSVFRFRKVFGSTGVLTRNCIVRVKGTHVVLGNGDIYQHDGQNMRSIVDGKMRDTFFSVIDDENFENSFAVYLEAEEEVWFCVPTTGKTRPDVALTWNVTTEEFGYRSIPDADFAATGVVADIVQDNSWDSDGESWDSDTTVWLSKNIKSTEDVLLIVDGVLDKVFQANTGTDHDGLGYTSTVGRLGLDLGDAQRDKAIRRIWPLMTAPENTQFTIELFNQRDARSGQEQVEVQTFTPDTQGIAVNSNARFLGVRISTDASVDWEISGMDIEYMPKGRF